LSEQQRLQALNLLAVMDTAPEAVFDGLANAASLVCEVPITLVTFVGATRQWFKANKGLAGISETPREAAFCAHAIAADDFLEVPDTHTDKRFCDNPLVTGHPHIRFYAGAPLRLENGAVVGTLCVIDHVPRRLTVRQRAVLMHLAEAAVQALQSRHLGSELARSEARFRALSESAPLGIFGTDKAGACNYANQQWRTLFGLNMAQARGDGWTQALHPDDRAAVGKQWLESAERQEDFSMEFRLQHADMRVLHVRALARPLIDDAGNIIGHVGSVEDITRRKAQEDSLRKHASLLRETNRLADVGGWELELSTGSLLWSEQTYVIHGLDPEQALELRSAIEFVLPDARKTFQAAIEKALNCGENWDLELPLSRADGQLIWVRCIGRAECIDGTPVRLVGAYQDVTLRVLQRRATELAHERMSVATDSGQIGVWEWDLLANSIDWTPPMYRLYGISPDSGSITQEQVMQQVHPEDRPALAGKLDACLSGTEDLDTEFRVVREQGAVHYLRATARVIRDASGTALKLVGISWDLTPIRTLSAELAEQKEFLHVTLKSIGDAVITTDSHGAVTWLNPAAEQLTGWTLADAVGQRLSQVFNIVHEQTRQKAPDPVAICLQVGELVGLAEQTVLISRDGREIAIEDSAAPIRNATNQLLGVVLVFHDVTEQRRLSREMSHRAKHDALTGLVNRAEFEACFETVFATTKADDRCQHALMYIDLDQFKLVNDACGHAVGDQLLLQIAKLLKDCVRAEDTLARLGGDEFGILLENCTSDQARRIAQKICDHMDDFRFEQDGRRFRIGTSIGLVPLDARWPNTAAVLQAADSACYAAKDAGRNRVHVWFDTDLATLERRKDMQWTTRLEQALDEDQFQLHLQVIRPVRGQDEGLYGEVLIRLKNEDGNLVAPGAFLPAAERFHLATRIDRWVLQKTIEQMSCLNNVSLIRMLSINLSGQSVGDRAFYRSALDVLQDAGPELCKRLCVEITETAAVTNLADATRFINSLQELGVSVALDDFGAGASSFGYIKKLPVDILKIDGQFIRDMVNDPIDKAAVRCFVDVADLLGLKTVAEFVDSTKVMQQVRDAGIDYAQGHLLHKPEPMQHVLEKLVTAPAWV